jgi:hypothetical protein
MFGVTATYFLQFIYFKILTTTGFNPKLPENGVVTNVKKLIQSVCQCDDN